jgi:phosphonoacetaldehyde hydrolase
MLGLRQHEVAKLDREELVERLDAATTAFEGEGAHYVVESFADLPDILDDIDAKLAEGGRP